MGAEGLLLRPAKESDRRTLWRIHTLAVEALCLRAYAPHEVSTWVRLLKPEGYLRPERPRTVLVAERGRRAVGFGQVDAALGELEALYVVPDEAGHGVGPALLSALESAVWRGSAPLLGLDASLNAEHFYQRHGYASVHSSRRPLTVDVQLACVRMQKQRPATAMGRWPAWRRG
ncbi:MULTISPECIES: GNAT family N-acetyltransferase [unclassified Myxococcus]|uniref:GNAT family N-acetyltransferase n=1 Tax=unclassified Myxococcus TaxID=2648731 RepID=UPI0011466007|nr:MULTISPECIES: GNAT family N-acetyltransferase [unclassified Myxococcus]